MVDPVPRAGRSRPGWYGSEASEFRERGFAFGPFEVITNDDEDLAGGVNTDAELIEQMRGTKKNELLNL